MLAVLRLSTVSVSKQSMCVCVGVCERERKCLLIFYSPKHCHTLSKAHLNLIMAFFLPVFVFICLTAKDKDGVMLMDWDLLLSHLSLPSLCERKPLFRL